jgi:arylformamidase
MLVDLSMPLSPASIPVPGHPSPAFEPLHLIERDGLRNTVVTLSLHTSTHIDAPSHFIDDGATIDEIPIDRFRRPGIRLDLTGCQPGAPIGRSDLEGAGFEASASKDAILILASGWTDRAWTTPELYGGNPYLALDAAEAFAAAGPSAIGLDFAVDSGRPWPNHTVLLGAEVLLIENLLGIARLPPDGFTVYAFPLRVARENGSPARVVAELPG